MKERPENPPLPGKIGPYKIEALLDKGGMSYLYLGIHPETYLPLAIKVLSKKYISHPEVIQSFITESEIISMTNHPNIVKLHAHGEWEGGLYIAMEYIEGTSLRKYFHKNPLSLQRAVSMMIEIAYALCHLHTHGVIHRDLKPENILVTEKGEIKVIDFGIAQLLSDKELSDEPPKARLIGTPIYISPEQRDNPESVSFPSDIYSLGIIAYELILGKPSMGHIQLSLMPKGMQPILSKCLQPNPDDRYQDIVDFITDASTYLNSPALQKEKQPVDALCEMDEEMRRMYPLLASPTAPPWNPLELGLATYRGLGHSEVFYHYIETGHPSHGLLIGESGGTTIENFFNNAFIMGAIAPLKTIANQPEAFVSALNDLLFREKKRPFLHFTYMHFNPSTHEVSCIVCGQSSFWHIPFREQTINRIEHRNDLLGLEQGYKFSDSKISWKPGDALIVGTSPIHQEKKILASINECVPLSAQDCVDHLSRKIRLNCSDKDTIPSYTLLCIRYKTDF